MRQLFPEGRYGRLVAAVFAAAGRRASGPLLGDLIRLESPYATFAFCYLKTFEIEGLIAKKSLEAQFEHEKTVVM